jgi:hypothetical protein
MSAISIRGIDEELARLLRKEAESRHKSLNQLVLDLLKSHVGLDKKKKFTNKYHDLDTLFGRWDESDFNAIQEKINAEKQIDEALWK